MGEKYGMFSRIKKKAKKGYNDRDKAKLSATVRGSTTNEEAMRMQEEAQEYADEQERKKKGKSDSWFEDGGIAKEDCGMFSKLKKKLMKKK